MMASISSRVQNIDELASSIARHGGYTDGLVFHNVSAEVEDESNVGLVAASSIEAGVVVLAVPVKCIVTPNDGVKCSYGRKLVEVCSALNAAEENSEAAVATMLKKYSIFLALGLLDESTGCSDYRHFHIGSLPSQGDFSTFPTFWDDADRKALEEASTLGLTMFKQKLAQWETEFNTLKSLLSPDEASDLKFRREQWFWARTVISSRNMQIPLNIFKTTFNDDSLAEERVEEFTRVEHSGESVAEAPVEVSSATMPVIVPLADLANHSNSPNLTWGFNPVLRQFEMRTIRPVECGEELTINYGFQPSWKFLIEYGFVPTVNSKHPDGVYESELKISSRVLSLFPSNPDDEHSLNSEDVEITALRKELWQELCLQKLGAEIDGSKRPETAQTNIILTSNPASSRIRFIELINLCRAGAISNLDDALALRESIISPRDSNAWHLVSPRNELHALQLLSEVLQTRGSALRKSERLLKISPSASSCLTLLKYESTLVRAISRAVDDAVIVAGGITADGMSELASEVIADYLDPLPWEKGAGWRYYAPWARDYILYLLTTLQ